MSPGSNKKTVVADRHGALFTMAYSIDGRFSVRLGGQELRFPENSFDEQSGGRWGPEMRVLALSSDGRRMAVDASGHGDGEVWDLQTGCVLAVLPLDGQIAFLADNESLIKMTDRGAVDLLYFGPANARPRSWASEAAMSTLLRGRVGSEWRTGQGVLRAISTAGKDGDAVSKRLSEMLSEAWP